MPIYSLEIFYMASISASYNIILNESIVGLLTMILLRKIYRYSLSRINLNHQDTHCVIKTYINTDI